MDRRITIGRPQSRVLINLSKTDILDPLPLGEYISGGALKTLYFFFTLGFINKDHDKVIHNDHYKYVYAIYNRFFKVSILICI